MRARAALGCRTNRNPGETSTASHARMTPLGLSGAVWAASVESDFTKRGSKGLLSRLVLLPHPLYRSPFPLYKVASVERFRGLKTTTLPPLNLNTRLPPVGIRVPPLQHVAYRSRIRQSGAGAWLPVHSALWRFKKKLFLNVPR
jgi:hypothetical protein